MTFAIWYIYFIDLLAKRLLKNIRHSINFMCFGMMDVDGLTHKHFFQVFRSFFAFFKILSLSFRHSLKTGHDLVGSRHFLHSLNLNFYGLICLFIIIFILLFPFFHIRFFLLFSKTFPVSIFVFSSWSLDETEFIFQVGIWSYFSFVSRIRNF